ncbi:MAG: HDIG domain-containing protein [Chloroflexi bacterium]|nr:HDIG domain-containing protein [Chloroflexota bacterium]
MAVLAFTAALAVTVTPVLGLQLLPSRFVPVEAAVVPQTIRAPHSFTYESQVVWELNRDAALASVQPVLRYDPGVRIDRLQRLETLDQNVNTVLEQRHLTIEEKAQALLGMETGLPERSVLVVAALAPPQWQTLREESRRVLTQALNERIPPAGVNQMRDRVGQWVNLDMPAAHVAIILDRVRGLIQPTTVVDEAATADARERAVAAVMTPTITVEQGTELVRAGQILRAADLEKLAMSGALSQEARWPQLAASFLLAVAACSSLGIYLSRFERRHATSPRRLLLLGVVLAATLLGAKLIIPGRDLWALLFPLAAGPMVVANLLGAPVGLVAAGFLSPLAVFAVRGTLNTPDLQLLLAYLLGSAAGVLAVWNADRFHRFLVAGVAVSLATFLVVLSFWLVDGGGDTAQLGLQAVSSVGNGFLSAVLTLGIVILLGLALGVPTTLHLVELSHPNQPLLKRLLREAPGTYQHSLMVGTLAESAAQAIGADAVLARVGAYYHDVGKLVSPGHFIENQLDGENVHASMEPRASAAIIRSHVTEGIELARRHGIPARIRDFIPEHHGTRLATYFYAIACRSHPDVDPELFRYPGPKPRHKETAIVMLADAIEATVRAGRDRSPEAIDEIVERTVNERIVEGQFDECDLTLQDLEGVKRALKDTLRAMYHPRVEYPAVPTSTPSAH